MLLISVHSGIVGNDLSLLLFQCVDAKKYCWYFDGGYPIYFMYVHDLPTTPINPSGLHELKPLTARF